jgi:hypothetical protein
MVPSERLGGGRRNSAGLVDVALEHVARYRCAGADRLPSVLRKHICPAEARSPASHRGIDPFLDSLDEQRRLRSAVAKVPTVIAVTNDKRWRHQYLMIGFGRLVWCA